MFCPALAEATTAIALHSFFTADNASSGQPAASQQQAIMFSPAANDSHPLAAGGGDQGLWRLLAN